MSAFITSPSSQLAGGLMPARRVLPPLTLSVGMRLPRRRGPQVNTCVRSAPQATPVHVSVSPQHTGMGTVHVSEENPGHGPVGRNIKRLCELSVHIEALLMKLLGGTAVTCAGQRGFEARTSADDSVW